MTVDQERMFQQSLFGQRIREEIDTRGETLAAENRELEAELSEEERKLTDLRSTLPTEEFRLRAATFDEKVSRFRTEQDAKARALSELQDEARQTFVRLVSPILSQMLEEIGATILLDRRAVLSASASADITDRAIARIDGAIGEGEDELSDPVLPEPDAARPETPREPPAGPALGMGDGAAGDTER